MGHLLCSCSTFTLKEGLEMVEEVSETVSKKLDEKEKNGENPKPKKEGYRNMSGGSSALYEAQFASSKSHGYIMPPNTWSAQTLTYSPGKTPDSGIQAILDRPKQPIPLPEGELDFFATTPFKPECCPNLYSNSTGCACVTVDQYNYIQQRGGNNVPYSEY